MQTGSSGLILSLGVLGVVGRAWLLTESAFTLATYGRARARLD